VLLLWLLTVAACATDSQNADERPEAFVALKMGLSDYVGGYRVVHAEAPLSVEVTADGWRPTLITLTGVQTEVTLIMEAARSYLGSNGLFSASSELQQVVLGHGESFELELELDEAPTDAGAHEFRVEIPAWVNGAGQADGEPDGTVTVMLTYNVFDADRIQGITDFCDTVIPLVNGLVPTDAGFDRIRDMAVDLDGDTGGPVIQAADQVEAEIDRPLTLGYDTSPLVEEVADVCGRYDLYSVGGIA